MAFAQLGVGPVLVEALAQGGITEPTDIQTGAIPVLLEGRSATVSSETGTGKTLAYLLPLFCRIDPTVRSLQAIVLAPTHELAMQIYREGHQLAQRAGSGIRVQALIGGVSVKRQIEKLKQKPHLVVGSAGRIGELIGMGKLKVNTVQTIVIDETDRMLYGDSLKAVETVVRATLRERQLVFVSATEQPESARVAETLSPGLVRVHTGCNRVVRTIEHCYLTCEGRDKPGVLASLIHALRPERAIAFVHRNEDAEIIAAKLAYRGIAAADLHSALDKTARKRALGDFRSGRVHILVASDVAARGLDVEGVTHIINVDAPTRSKAYLHRTGRTGRAGATGCAVSLMTAQEARLVRRYEAELGIVMVAVRLYGGRLLEIPAPGDGSSNQAVRTGVTQPTPRSSRPPRRRRVSSRRR